ncbi:hypothetical protein SEA_STROSAHL_45 [Gordonia phage Strosahl]|uniref:Uncharacterized protein n=3 Tax=Soupsvirus TaxID=1982562 RepID=A0A1B3B1A2_9CAUD|nr:hypothetical protein BIZ67_gp065 [Gordonia phage Remus]YP_009596246.1 hypothetical protein FDH03_gp065 [Gordonia phage Strosahl]YP_009624559.1 hypothetical protein FDJ48_gp066 [Gordonia phage Waits]AOE44655.1 hypothetical protein SEA_REMUS_45 [Gordonia phage Remus]AOE44756.1 hypothetical protein SEA_STROSAHL_45 [Gordonia phage Strosahl]AVO22074.1 hypothetical protein PBI_WAITS_44 [Gordonia phage Waits]
MQERIGAVIIPVAYEVFASADSFYKQYKWLEMATSALADLGEIVGHVTYRGTRPVVLDGKEVPGMVGITYEARIIPKEDPDA